MKTLYTSHVAGDRSTATQRIVELPTIDHIIEHVASEAGIDPDALINDPTTLVNEYGIFITSPGDCIESWVLIG